VFIFRALTQGDMRDELVLHQVELPFSGFYNFMCVDGHILQFVLLSHHLGTYTREIQDVASRVERLVGLLLLERGYLAALSCYFNSISDLDHLRLLLFKFLNRLVTKVIFFVRWGWLGVSVALL
jgi:hypothetical protein